MKLSLYEQETIILYNQAEATAEVYSHDPKLLESCGGWRRSTRPDREKGPADLYRSQTLCVGAGTIQRRTP